MATLILKATEKCNSNCYYCDVVYNKKNASSMSVEVLEQVFIRINEFLEDDTGQRIEILWHGGEPLLMGTEFYQQAVSFQERYCRNTQSRINHGMQTNLNALNENFLEIFKALGITSVGTSYDPIPHMRGPGKNIDSDIYNRNFMRGISILDENDISWGVIYVVTRKSLPRARDLFFFLTNLGLSGNININPVLIYDSKRTDVAITSEEYVSFLGEFFEFWWERRRRFPAIEPFRSLVENIINRKNRLFCVYSGNCAFQNINISPSGEASQCGRSDDWGLLQYGNIFERSLKDILKNPQRDALIERNDILRQTECKDCRFWNICHGGCPLDSYSRHGDFVHKSEWCSSRINFIEKYFEPITGVKYVPFGN